MGTVDITPEVPLPLFGRAGRSQPFLSIASQLEANFMLMSDGTAGDAALVTIDSLYPSQALVEKIIARTSELGLNIGPASLIVVASHTHNAPSLDQSKPKLGQYVPDYLTFVANRIAAALVKMKESSEGASTIMRHGTAQSRFSVYRRRWLNGIDFARLRISKRIAMAPNPTRPIDQTLNLVVIQDYEDKPQAVLWSWPCHAVSEPEPNAVSADFPGALRQHIRTQLGDSSLPVLFLPGFSGDIRPALTRRLSLIKSGSWVGICPRFAKRSPHQVKLMHANLATTFDRAWSDARKSNRIDSANMTLARKRRILELEEIRTDAGGLDSLSCDDWRIGPLRIKAVSAEVAAGYTHRTDSDEPMTFLTGCAGQVFGYLPTDDQIIYGGYEVDGFASAFSVPGSFHSQIESKVSALIGP
ncbi:MAG: hypothetical protein ACSHWZ_18745 [Sulfitobacter sp.]|uniref:hypothetical protein n=1 Tax=Celeribacter marinus TaxID=1397108 RepID=UPI00317203D8